MSDTAKRLKLVQVATAEEQAEVMRLLSDHPSLKEQVRHYQRDLQFSARGLATDLGLDVIETSLPWNLAGFLNPTPDAAGWEIVLNRSISEVHKRWAIVHELCHWIVDMKCAPPPIGCVRIPPLFNGALKEGTYSSYEVKVIGRARGQDGAPKITALVVQDPFIDVDQVMRSERMVNWLSGYILMPARTLRPFLRQRRRSKAETALRYGVPTPVAGMQMAIELNTLQTSLPRVA